MALPPGAWQLHADPAGVGDLHGVAGSGGQRSAVQVLFCGFRELLGLLRSA